MLNQTQLTVQVKNVVLGTIETDADDVLAFIEERIEDYAVDKYQGDSDAARKDRAELNKADKRMQETAKELTDRFMAPLQPTLDKLKRGRVLIRDASAKVDELVKAKEAEEDEKKRNQIIEYWNTRGFDLVPLERIFDSRWLNKGMSLSKEVYPAIDAKIKEILESIKTIEDAGEEDLVPTKSRYLETLDLGNALRYRKQLKDDRDRLAREAAARPEREHNEKIAEQQAEIDEESMEEQRVAPVASLASLALGGDAEPEDELAVLVMEFTAPKSELLGLKQYLTAHGILFRKIEVPA